MAKVVVFGNALTAELAHYYLTHDSVHEIVAFTVNEAYIQEKQFRGLPLVPFEEIEKIFPPHEFKFFVPLTERRMNQVRADVYGQVKQIGYSCISYVSSRATVLTDQIGENCFILEDNTIQPFVSIGNNVVLWSGNHIGHHSIIRDHAYFTSHVVLSGRCDVGEYSFFGVNATVRDGCQLGTGTLISMGANLVVQQTPEWSVWKGNPARMAEVSSKDVNL